MKKVISLMLALVLALSLTACGGKAGPEGVVGQFCKGLQELDEKAIAQCFENGDDLELSDQLLDILTSNIYGALEDFGAGLLG